CDITPADYIETRYGHSVFLRAYQSLVTPISILAIMGSQLISFVSLPFSDFDIFTVYTSLFNLFLKIC
ncbi:hypothetical protein D1N53_22965, partial [Clostridioides difficile]